MEDVIDKLGELLVSYDNILDEFNTLKICNYFLEKENKILDMVELMTNKYKDSLSSEILNYFILQLFIIYDKKSLIKNKDKLFNNIEKILTDYSDILSDENLKIFINMAINLNSFKKIYK